MEQQVIPYLLYEDGEAAIEFLTKAFGFDAGMRTTGSGGGMHPELEVEPGGIEEPTDQDYGHRRYGCVDPQGHEWYFAQPIEEARSDG